MGFLISVLVLRSMLKKIDIYNIVRNNNMEIKKDVIYRSICTHPGNGILACGYMPKSVREQSQFDFTIDYYSCFLLLSGSGQYYTKDGQKLPLNAGDLVQRFPGICHSTEIIPDGKWFEFFISFGHTTYDYLCSLNLIPVETPVMHIQYDESTLQYFSWLLQQLKSASEKELPFLSLKAQEIVLQMLRKHSVASMSDTFDEIMEEACRILSRDTHSEISLEEVANLLHMGYENFRKKFRIYSGKSPSQYRIEQKMKQAKLMLSSGVSIKETALLTGYSDAYSFTKQFTHSVGISPGRYKHMP